MRTYINKVCTPCVVGAEWAIVLRYARLITKSLLPEVQVQFPQNPVPKDTPDSIEPVISIADVSEIATNQESEGQETVLPALRTWLPDLYLAGLIVTVFVVDQISKGWVRNNIFVWDSIPRDGFFRITHVNNTGGAFGLFPNQTFILMLASLIAVGFLLIFFRRYSFYGIWLRTSLGLQLGGAAGNLADRLTLGKVTDFIDVGPWPVFNLADSSVVVGIIILAWLFYRSSRETAEAAEPPPQDEGPEPEDQW